VRPEVYWATPFAALCSFNRLTEFVVLDVEPVTAADGKTPLTFGKYALADATIARVRDFGVNDTVYITRTHLGHLLQPGDNAWGFDVACANTNDDHANTYDFRGVEIVLVKKSYTDRRKRRVRRYWKLRTLNKEEGDEGNYPEEACVCLLG
jgi:nonsense-mediated mRNA decay protein 3